MNPLITSTLVGGALEEMTSAPQPLIPVPRGPVPVAPPAPLPRMIEIHIDGQAVSVPEGATILDAARKLGIHTPTLCFLESLTPVNVCRVCVVELEGSRTLVPACSRKVEPGMSVKTDSDRVRLSRRVVLEFLASSVDVSTAPALQEYMERYDAHPERYGASPATVAQPPKIDNDLYVRDYSKCILCYKCVEACGVDAQNTFAIAVAGRGFSARIATEFDVPLQESACVYCGNCIGVCPTGALMFRSEYDMREAGTWDESRQSQSTTICPYCGVGCNVTVHEQDGNIVKVTSPVDHNVTQGNLCIKGRFGWQFVQIQQAEKQTHCIPFHMGENSPGNDFIIAARQRWQQLAQELQADVTTFNSLHGGADFSETPLNEFRVSNLTTGLELIITADFDERVIRYNYEQMSDKSAGVPEGGMLSMRQSQTGPVEFYSADEQLTSQETRDILLQPVLLPPEMAA